MKSVAIFLLQLIAAWDALAAPQPNTQNRLPPKVVAITQRQIESYLGTNGFKGVPLLDTAVDWNFFTNWPDQFTFQGRTYHLKLTDTSGGDYVTELKSRTEVKPGMSFLAKYDAGTAFPPPLGVSSAWRGDGSVAERIVDRNGQRVFGHLLVPNGRLYSFLRDDRESKGYEVEYYDRSGQLVGRDRSIAGADRQEWRGVRVDEETFERKRLELYQEVAK